MDCGLGLAAKAQKTGLTSPYVFHVFHAVLLPPPPKEDTMSHPVKALKHRQGDTNQDPELWLSHEQQGTRSSSQRQRHPQFRDVKVLG